MSLESFEAFPVPPEKIKNKSMTPEEIARLKELAKKSRQSIRGVAKDKEEFLRLLSKAEAVFGEDAVQKILDDSANESAPEK